MNNPNPTLTVLDHTGDSTYTWNAEQDRHVRGIIRDMLANGFVFYVPRRTLLGVKRDVVQHTDQLTSTVELVAQTESAFYQRLHGLVPAERPAAEPMARSQDVDEIAAGGAIARRQTQGG